MREGPYWFRVLNSCYSGAIFRDCAEKAVTGLCVFTLTAILTFVGGELMAESYASLDKKIVSAYNSDPKRMNDVYRYAMEIVEKTRLDSSKEADAWQDKAQRLVTIACCSEVDKALQNKKYSDAYIWALRGVTNGESRGEIGSLSIKQIYDFLKDVVNQLKTRPEIQNMSYGSQQLQVRDYRSVPKTNKAFPEDKKDFSGQRVVEQEPYSVEEGPGQDASGNLYVIVRLNFGGRLKIRYYPKQGWMGVNLPDSGKKSFYGSWQECARANANVKNLKGVPASVIRNPKTDTREYYVPAKGSIDLKSSKHTEGGQ